MDIADKAAQTEELFFNLALKKQQITPQFSEIFCIDCDEEIPEARRTAIQGVKRCITCQEIHEKRRKGYK